MALFWKFRRTGCSERRLIGHSFYRRNFLRKSCATCREKCHRAGPRTEKSDKPAQWTPCIFDENNASVRHHILRSLINLHNDHRVYLTRKMPSCGTLYWEVWWTCTMNTMYIGRENCRRAETRTKKFDKPAQWTPYIQALVVSWAV
jgi:hypothetical protein